MIKNDLKLDDKVGPYPPRTLRNDYISEMLLGLWIVLDIWDGPQAYLARKKKKKSYTQLTRTEKEMFLKSCDSIF